MVLSPYFDSLPLHPLPRYLESLSSYILRLAEANEISSFHELSVLLDISTGTLSRLADYPLLCFGTMPARASAKQETILATTLYYFSTKFGRSPRPSPLARFLKGSIGSHLRYCPVCLSENNYYRLTWRFLVLPGCAAHGCRLLDCCSHCGTTLPLISFPLKVGVCPACGGNLDCCRAEPLSERESKETAERTLDLKYLLSPHSSEQSEVFPKAVGRNLGVLRREKQLLAQNVAAHLGVPENHIGGIERGGKNQGAPFWVYVKYADYLGVSLRDIFTKPSVRPEKQVKLLSPTPSVAVSKQQSSRGQNQREAELLKRLREAIPELKAQKKSITTKTVSEFVGLTPQGIQHYPTTKALWEQIRQEIHTEQKISKQQREEELLVHVREAIAALLANEHYPSQEAIGKLVKLSPGGLRYYPRVRTLIKESMAQQYHLRLSHNQQTEAELLKQVQAAYTHLQGLEQSVTQQQISDMLGLSLHRLRLYPQVRAILDQITEEGRRLRKQQANSHELVLAEQVHQAIQQLLAQKQLLSRQAVGKVVGLTPRALARYPQIRPLLSQISKIYKMNGPRRTKRRERELLKQVRQIMKQLQEQGLPITQKAVSVRLGLTTTALKYYPGFRKVYSQIRIQNRREQHRQAQEKEAVLFEQVQATIQQLRNNGTPLTLQKISKRVRMSIAGLRRYPQIKELLQKVAEERRKANQS